MCNMNTLIEICLVPSLKDVEGQIREDEEHDEDDGVTTVDLKSPTRMIRFGLEIESELYAFHPDCGVCV